MTANHEGESGWVCTGCGYALEGLDQRAPCPECGGWERRDTRAPIVWRPWKFWAVVVLAAVPALALVVMVVILPRWVATHFNGFDRQPEALLLMGPLAIAHGVLVGAATIPGVGAGSIGRRLRMASGAIFLAPCAVFFDLIALLITWFLIGVYAG